MLRKDLRSMVLSLVVGDGCLHYIKNNGRLYGAMTIDHGLAQSDYQKWKAELLSHILQRNVKVRTAHKGKSVQISVCMKRFKAWRKFCYPNGKKDVSKILRFINNPQFMVAVWLMDDGYCEPSFSKLADGTKKLYGCRFRIFSCETPIEEHHKLVDWFYDNLKVEAKVKIQRTRGKEYPFIKFGQTDSLKLWEEVREFILQFKSMRHKFRHMEQTYQYRIKQRSLDN